MRYSIVILLSLTFSAASGQISPGTESYDSTNIYYQALKIYLKGLTKESKALPLLVERDFLITPHLPKEFNGFVITYVDGNDISRLLKGKKEITVIRMIPLRVVKGDFFINVIPFGVQKEKKSIRYINSGGTSVHFQFDDNLKSFRFSEVKVGGV